MAKTSHQRAVVAVILIVEAELKWEERKKGYKKDIRY
ncbi:hypothetical protein CCACVL1_22404 [Corchorus capsularis]|uniref:Uncharacterized protein n=1 Tax=Corchorus capsularis TaxID=210143 RepID=A0A1R3GZA2_COCAP|nr:hypothetical protein CCACVL1_22404 [Corchorus capsularis]